MCNSAGDLDSFEYDDFRIRDKLLDVSTVYNVLRNTHEVHVYIKYTVAISKLVWYHNRQVLLKECESPKGRFSSSSENKFGTHHHIVLSIQNATETDIGEYRLEGKINGEPKMVHLASTEITDFNISVNNLKIIGVPTTKYLGNKRFLLHVPVETDDDSPVSTSWEWKRIGGHSFGVLPDGWKKVGSLQTHINNRLDVGLTVEAKLVDAQIEGSQAKQDDNLEGIFRLTLRANDDEAKLVHVEFPILNPIKSLPGNMELCGTDSMFRTDGAIVLVCVVKSSVIPSCCWLFPDANGGTLIDASEGDLPGCEFTQRFRKINTEELIILYRLVLKDYRTIVEGIYNCILFTEPAKRRLEVRYEINIFKDNTGKSRCKIIVK